ncbi:MAG: ABC transporter ATP-binding protein [Thermovirgaceae bacterium]|nr:ABC transporter ATP-binding protein [Thermovirgaceae bacterium]
MSHHFLEVNDLYYSYPDGTEALKGVSLRLEHGEAVGLVGANGAGKSTLLLAVAGLVFSGSGTVNIGGAILSKKTLGEIRRRLGFIFQDPEDQLFMPTVFDDVAFGPLNQGLSAGEVSFRVEEALRSVGAGHLSDRPAYRLSGGEKRAVSIAAVLSMLPDILLMDEPSSGLDPRNRRMLIGLLGDFTHTRLIATHDLDLVLDVCPRTIVLHRGEIAADGHTEEIFRDEGLLERCSLEPPLCMQGVRS